jgi:hypothetical protein
MPCHAVVSTYTGGAPQHTLDLQIPTISMEWTLETAYNGTTVPT